MDGLLEDLFEAYFKARKNKRNKKDQLAFEQNFESSLIKLYEQIVQREFEPQPYTAFISQKQVIREVFAPTFRDRVVHHLIYRYLSEIFEPDFIDDSYSCRVGKGTLYGIYRVKDMLYTCSKGYARDCYILKLDISGYFYAIDKKLLYKMCIQKMQESFEHEKYVLVDYLLKKVLFDDVTKGAIKRGGKNEWELLPRHRSLFHCPKERGLPIGNLTSQLFSNIYMNAFDHFMKNDLGLKHYGRYVDDFVIVHPNKTFLKKLIQSATLFLRQHLGLTVHPKKIYLQHYAKGVPFLGAFIKPHRVYVGNRIKGNFTKLLRALDTASYPNGYTPGCVKEICCRINSYLGLMSHFNSFTLRKTLLQQLPDALSAQIRITDDFKKVSPILKSW